MSDTASQPEEGELRRLLMAYIDREAREGTPAGEIRSRAFEELDAMAREAPERCWRFIEVVLQSSLSDQDLAYIAAGPFEDLLGRHGARFLPLVEEKASDNPNMRMLIATVWQGRMSAENWKRVQDMRLRFKIDPL